MYDVTASIVVYKSDRVLLQKAIGSFLGTSLKSRLFIIDNSPDDALKDICIHKDVEYIFVGRNLGFGAAHNIVLSRMLEKTKYALILNPDVYFDAGVLEKMFSYMERNPEIGFLMPKVLYPDGSAQYLCRLLPTPFDLILRKFYGKASNNFINFFSKYELRFADYTMMMDVPYLSGCFMFLRSKVLSKIGLFDERFFLYFEDLDLSRRIYKMFRCVYFPDVVVYHSYGRGSNKDRLLLKQIIYSAFQYFNKWGWFFDKERTEVNRETLRSVPCTQKD